MKSDLKRRICQLMMEIASISKTKADLLAEITISMVQLEINSISSLQYRTAKIMKVGRFKEDK